MEKATLTIEYPTGVDKVTYHRHILERVIDHALFSGLSRREVMLLLQSEYDFLDYSGDEL